MRRAIIILSLTSLALVLLSGILFLASNTDLSLTFLLALFLLLLGLLPGIVACALGALYGLRRNRALEQELRAQGRTPPPRGSIFAIPTTPEEKRSTFVRTGLLIGALIALIVIIEITTNLGQNVSSPRLGALIVLCVLCIPAWALFYTLLHKDPRTARPEIKR